MKVVDGQHRVQHCHHGKIKIYNVNHVLGMSICNTLHLY
jgi:hypothetical protein